MDDWVEVLLKSRSHFIPSSNPYLFASMTERSHLRGTDALRRFSLACGAKKPQLLRSTKLRKNLASMAQVLCLKEHEMDQLASFLGHDLRVHREFYRLPLDVLQVARISKVFLAAEQGNIAQYAGKGLDDIEITSEDVIQTDPDEQGRDSDGSCSEVPSVSTDSESEESDGHGKGKQMKTNAKQKSIKRKWTAEEKSSERSDVPRVWTNNENEESEAHGQRKQTTRKKRRTCNKIQWTDKEKSAVRRHFAPFIVRKRLPGKEEIEQFIHEQGISRHWKKVKDHIRNSYCT